MINARVTVSLNGFQSAFLAWSPEACFLAAGIASGLHHFPVDAGPHIYIHNAHYYCLSRVLDIQAGSRRVSAVIDPHESPSVHGVAFPDLAHPDLSYVPKYSPLHILEDSELASILSALLGSAGHSETIRALMMSFLKPAHLFPIVSTIMVFHPLGLPNLNLSNLAHYEQHLVEELRPICADLDANRVSSFWLLMTIRLDNTWAANNSTEVETLCDRVFDLLATFTPTWGDIRPRELLRLDPRYIGESVILVARYRHSRI